MWLAWSASLVVIAAAFLRHRRNNYQKFKGLYFHEVDTWYYLKAVLLSIALTVHKTFSRIYRRKHPEQEVKLHDISSPPSENEEKSISFTANDADGNILSVWFRRHFGQVADVGLTIRLANGTTLTHTPEPECLVIDETPTGDEADEGYVSASGLRIRAVDPMRTYRLLYSGIMRHHQSNSGNDSTTNRYTHVSLRIWFRALTDAANFNIDYSPETVARFLAIEPWTFSCFQQFVSPTLDHTQQSGEMRGVLDVFGTRRELILNGLKDHKSGHQSSLAESNASFAFRVRFDSGLVFSLHLIDNHRTSGFAYFQNGFVYPIEWVTLENPAKLAESGNIPAKLSISIGAHGRIYDMRVEVLSSSKVHLALNSTSCYAKAVLLNFVKVFMTGGQVSGENIGYGTIEFNNRGEISHIEKGPPQVLLRTIPQPVFSVANMPHCVQLSDAVCRISAITGGKAAKLAEIVAVVSKIEPKVNNNIDFKVPDGFVVTVVAYENHLKSAPNLHELIGKLIRLSATMNHGAQSDSALTKELEEACKNVQDEFVGTPLTTSLQEEIRQHLVTTFGEQDWNSAFTAVRSSAIGEDGAEASGAGQMETFLGIRGLEKICEAIKWCWASHFSFRAVQYRRQLCAALDSPMAVIVQELVKAEVAGVLFTRHPDNGSTARSVINACYGMGEGVVSGHVHPDTISVYKEDPTSDDVDDLRIAYDLLGEKATAYRLDEKKGIVEEEDFEAIELDKNAGCCLDEDEIKRLYRVGKFIERIFGSSRDVEFALKKEDNGTPASIFILQARPITTADMEDDWELLHELDTPLASDKEWLTTANVQEMMPGALSPLSSKVWIDIHGEALERPQSDMFLKPKQRFLKPRLVAMSHQHVFMNWMTIGCGMTEQFTKIACDMALFGRVLDHLTPEMFIEQNDMSSKLSGLLYKLMDWQERYFPRKGMAGLVSKIESLQVPTTTNPAILYRQIEELMPFVQQVWVEHVRECTPSIKYPVVIMSIMDSTMKWTPQIYEDMATLLSSCTDVYSADVPTLVQDVAQSIIASSDDDHLRSSFLQMERSDAAKWLLSSESNRPGQLFRKFLAKHGHRCVRDSDIRERSWAQEPEKVVDAIKVMLSANNGSPAIHQKKQLSVDEALDAIKTPLTNNQRLKIKVLLPRARIAVGKREWAKSYGIMMSNLYRLHVYRLAKLLTDQGYLSDIDLIFFLLPHEIRRLVERRSPKLIAKALRRRKIFAKFSGLQFQELFRGHGEPVKADCSQEVIPNAGEQFSIKGTAVGQGSISGRARVVKSQADANQIQAGDVLIVRYTDVGWTPYFPMISGLVTELGGLISHGAVVAREYGLPCLVGCKHATDLIKTGDQVSIDGHSGEIKVIAQPAK